MANRIRIEGDITYMELTRGQETRFDAADLSLVTQFQWYATPNKSGSYYVASAPEDHTIYMHRLIMGVTERKTQVDHWSRDTLDNRRENLRIATNQQNNENKGISKTRSSTGVRGVCVNKVGRNTYYKARVMVDNRNASERTFPFTDEGLQQATYWVTEERKRLMTFAVEPELQTVSLPNPRIRPRLSDEAVREIRMRAKRGDLYKDIARDFGILPSNISRMAQGLTRASAGGELSELIPHGSRSRPNKGHGSY